MTDSTQSSYDRVAEEYTRRIADELNHKPFDRKMLDWLIEKVNGAGIICDMGCGPGHIARYLHQHGAATCGIDLSSEMVRQASILTPDVQFSQGNMVDLSGAADGSFAGIAAFYSLIHISPEDIPTALRELNRVLKPDGVLLVTFHIGQEVRHFDEWWGQQVSLDFRFFEPDTIKTALQDAGFVIEDSIQRDPYPEIEVQTRRAYIFARNPRAV